MKTEFHFSLTFSIFIFHSTTSSPIPNPTVKWSSLLFSAFVLLFPSEWLLRGRWLTDIYLDMHSLCLCVSALVVHSTAFKESESERLGQFLNASLQRSPPTAAVAVIVTSFLLFAFFLSLYLGSLFYFFSSQSGTVKVSQVTHCNTISNDEHSVVVVVLVFHFSFLSLIRFFCLVTLMESLQSSTSMSYVRQTDKASWSSSFFSAFYCCCCRWDLLNVIQLCQLLLLYSFRLIREWGLSIKLCALLGVC